MGLFVNTSMVKYQKRSCFAIGNSAVGAGICNSVTKKRQGGSCDGKGRNTKKGKYLSAQRRKMGSEVYKGEKLLEGERSMVLSMAAIREAAFQKRMEAKIY